MGKFPDIDTCPYLRRRNAVTISAAGARVSTVTCTGISSSFQLGDREFVVGRLDYTDFRAFSARRCSRVMSLSSWCIIGRAVEAGRSRAFDGCSRYQKVTDFSTLKECYPYDSGDKWAFGNRRARYA